MLMRVRSLIDFHAVERKHIQIHDRLENWARTFWGGAGSSASPMFRLYRSDEHWAPPVPSIPIDHLDAAKIGKGVALLPAPHSAALKWCYIRQSNPRKQCQALGVSMEGLALYIRDGRQMLVNRRV